MPQELVKFYEETGPERCGFVLENDEIIEVKNVAAEPEKGFEIAGADIYEYMYKATGMWHTHPGQDANLTMGDAESFQNFKKLNHFVIGNDGVRRYYFEGDMLLCDE